MPIPSAKFQYLEKPIWLHYRGGATSYLEVLTNETNAFNAELGLAQAQLNELLELIDIYRNLGGGRQL